MAVKIMTLQEVIKELKDRLADIDNTLSLPGLPPLRRLGLETEALTIERVLRRLDKVEASK